MSRTLGHYQLMEQIGKGGFGTVYRGFDRDLGRTVAIKQVKTAGVAKEDLEAIEREVSLLSKLSHPNVVKYIEAITDGDYINIILEYEESGALSNLLKKLDGAPPESLIARYTYQILEGLVYLHSQGVIHRDIKGANLLSTKDGVVKMADFGISSQLSDKWQTESVTGSPYWMAPEIIEMKQKEQSTSCDIWSLGCTIIELYTGSPPYSKLNAMSAMYQVVKDPHPPLPDGISAELRSFLMLCFQKDPKRRPAAGGLQRHPWLNKRNERAPAEQVPRKLSLERVVSSPSSRGGAGGEKELCSVKGCLSDAYRSGMCKKHYERIKAGHASLKPLGEQEEGEAGDEEDHATVVYVKSELGFLGVAPNSPRTDSPGGGAHSPSLKISAAPPTKGRPDAKAGKAMPERPCEQPSAVKGNPTVCQNCYHPMDMHAAMQARLQKLHSKQDLHEDDHKNLVAFDQRGYEHHLKQADRKHLKSDIVKVALSVDAIAGMHDQASVEQNTIRRKQAKRGLEYMAQMSEMRGNPELREEADGLLAAHLQDEEVIVRDKAFREFQQRRDDEAKRNEEVARKLQEVEIEDRKKKMEDLNRRLEESERKARELHKEEIDSVKKKKMQEIESERKALEMQREQIAAQQEAAAVRRRGPPTPTPQAGAAAAKGGPPSPAAGGGGGGGVADLRPDEFLFTCRKCQAVLALPKNIKSMNCPSCSAPYRFEKRALPASMAWECAACTYKNPGGAQCTMCGSQKANVGGGGGGHGHTPSGGGGGNTPRDPPAAAAAAAAGAGQATPREPHTPTPHTPTPSTPGGGRGAAAVAAAVHHERLGAIGEGEPDEKDGGGGGGGDDLVKKLMNPKGTTFLKMGRKGKPHERKVKVTPQGKLSWTSGDIPLSSILRIEIGKVTEVFLLDGHKDFTPDVCFSIITRDRTLDLAARNKRERDDWVNGLRRIIDKIPKKS